MEEICSAVCDRIFETGKSGYEIFYEDELVEVLPEDLKTRETLEAALKRLTSEGCIDVKYARGNAFCIAAVKRFTPKAATAEEQQPVIQQIDVSIPRKSYLLLAASAFLGGLIPAIILLILRAVI